MTDYFDDDAFDEIEEDILENADLSRAVKDFKDTVEGDLDADQIQPVQIEDELDSRDKTITEGLRSASTKTSKLTEKKDELKRRKRDKDFQRNYRDDSVDANDFDQAEEIIEKYEQLTGRLVLLIKVFMDDRDLLRDTVDIQLQRVEERKIHELTKEMVENAESQFEVMGEQMIAELADRFESIQESNEEVMRELVDKLGEQSNPPPPRRPEQDQTGSIGKDESKDRDHREAVTEKVGNEAEEEDDQEKDLDELGDFHRELYQLVDENPDEDPEWYADELDKATKFIKMQAAQIAKQDGFDDFSLE